MSISLTFPRQHHRRRSMQVSSLAALAVRSPVSLVAPARSLLSDALLLPPPIAPQIQCSTVAPHRLSRVGPGRQHLLLTRSLPPGPADDTGSNPVGPPGWRPPARPTLRLPVWQTTPARAPLPTFADDPRSSTAPPCATRRRPVWVTIPARAPLPSLADDPGSSPADQPGRVSTLADDHGSNTIAHFARPRISARPSSAAVCVHA